MYNKYHVSDKKDRTYGEIVFSSKKEMKRYIDLLMLLRADQISNLILQPKFLLQEEFTDNLCKKHRPIYYIADFQYIDMEKQLRIVEDVKGVKTTEYKIKRKMFLKLYPNLIHVEV